MAQIMIIGEAWGPDEERLGKPFVGASGRLLKGMLHSVGIDHSECYLTNVFNLRPQPTNSITNLCGPKSEGIPGRPYLQRGKYVKAEYGPELARLDDEIERQSPNLILALGGTPTWALLGTSGIRAIRGAPILANCGRKVLPTYHPAAILRDYKLKPIVLADLFKAKREAEFPEVLRPSRKIWLEPDIEAIADFFEVYIAQAHSISIDIETFGDTITCIGFAPDANHAIVIPFFDPSKPTKNYWDTFEEEKEAWAWVRKICGLEKKMIFQNGLYDMRFLWDKMGIPVPHAYDDTMLLHHALQPEMEKGLGFLATVYTDEASWKFMRKTSTIKKED